MGGEEGRRGCTVRDCAVAQAPLTGGEEGGYSEGFPLCKLLLHVSAQHYGCAELQAA